MSVDVFVALTSLHKTMSSEVVAVCIPHIQFIEGTPSMFIPCHINIAATHVEPSHSYSH
jgi:hypothetical protein